MTHDTYRELIQRELDGDLSAEEIALLEAHVVTCADCCQEREQFGKLGLVFGNIGNVKPDRSFVPQMVPELPKYVERKRRFAPQVWRGLSVAAVVVLAIGFSTNWQYGNLQQLSGDGQQIARVEPGAAQPEQPTAVPQQQVVEPASDQLTISAQTQSQPKLIAQETVKKKPQVMAVAAASGDVDKVESQTGVKVESGSTVSSGTTTDTQPNEMVVAAVDATATDVKVDGNNVTVTLVPVENHSEDSEVRVFGISDISPGTNTVTFTDPDGNVISTTQVDLSPSDRITGKNTQLNGVLNEQLQEQAKRGESAWATDSYEVVRRHLTDLGFASNAQVSSTNIAEVVNVMQGGMHYSIQLEQPFDKGKQGIWRPVQIARMINAEQPQAFEKPILEFFNGLKAGGSLTGAENFYVASPLTAGHVTVNVALTGQSTTEAVYEFTLKQLRDGAWAMNGQPTARK